MIFEEAQRIILFSESSKKILERTVGLYPTIESHCHGIEPVERRPVPVPQAPSSASPLKVACLGTFVPHKGSLFIARCAAEITEAHGAPIEWHYLGRGAEDVPGLIDQGAFTPANLRDKLAEIGAHVALLAPQCQETYSITLDEVVWSGLPVICSPYGALPERIQAWKVGYVGDNSIEGLRELLGRIANDWNAHKEVFSRTHQAPIVSVADEVATCSSIYRQLGSASTVPPDLLVRFLQPDLCWESPYSPRRLARRVKRTLARRIRYMLAESEATIG
jgi:glycosyltransferase involved in cell wall biosynthesis